MNAGGMCVREVHFPRFRAADVLTKIMRPACSYWPEIPIDKYNHTDWSETELKAMTDNMIYDGVCNTDGYFGQRGWTLGWGLNCAIGVKLAWPDRPVLALIGDGSAMYGIQGLWTAAHYKIPVTFVVPNNTEYRILKDCAKVLGLPEACRENYLALDLTGPAIDYVRLAESLGVAACRVTEPDELASVVSQSLSGTIPQLIEVPVKNPG